MSEETENVEEVLENVPENSSENVEEVSQENPENSSENVEEGSEEKSEEKSEKKKYEPWKIFKEKVIPETIPYSRFSEKVHEANTLQSKLSETEAELKKYKEAQEKISKIENFEDLKMENFSNLNEYNQSLFALAEKKTEQRIAKEREQERIQKIQNDIVENFNKNILKASTENDEIKAANNWVLSNYSNTLRPETLYTLITDEYGPQVIHEIATTEGMLESFLKMDPLDASRKIGKMSAKYEGRPANVSKATAQNLTIPKVMPGTKTPTGTPNTQGKPATSGKVRWNENMSIEEKKKLQKEGRLIGW